jgi:exosortase/archaeosortase family protein
MRLTLRNQYFISFILAVQLIIAFFCGMYSVSLIDINTFFLVFFTDFDFGINLFFVILTIILSLIHVAFILYFFPKELSSKQKLKNLIYLSLNFYFSYFIGYSISVMESNSKYNFGIVMIPLLVLFIFILVNHNFRLIDGSVDIIEGTSSDEANLGEKKRLSIEFENKKYTFKNSSLILFAIGTPIVSYLIYLFFDLHANYWLHEIVVKQTVYFLNLFFNMGADAVYNPVGTYYWRFTIPGKADIGFETFCTGIQAICVFAGLIIFIPHSQDKQTSKDIIWRKTKSLIISSVIFYVVNIFRMLIQLYLYNIGYPWDSIHVSISAASSFIAAIIILLLHRWIPEFIISIIYSGTLIKERFKSKNNLGNN